MLNVTISVDALEWTAHWLGRRRCDLLSIFLADNPEVVPQVRIVAVESKGRTETEPIDVRESAAPLMKLYNRSSRRWMRSRRFFPQRPRYHSSRI
jgi:hypothetical protein